MQQKREFNKKEGYCSMPEEPVMVTDMLATLFGELSAMFSSFSKIARTVVGLKEQLGGSMQQMENKNYQVTDQDSIISEEDGETNI